MKRFIIESMAFLSLMVLIFVVGLLAIERDPDTYLYESSTKLDILRTTKQPRIIFVGGSNLAFGLNTKAVGDSLHKNAINNGLHAGLGLKFIIDDIDEYLQRDDTVVICPEYSHFYGKAAYGEHSTSPILADYRPEILTMCNAEQTILIVKGLPKIFIDRMQQLKKGLKKLIRGDKPPTVFEYRKSGFNEYGDEVSHWTMKTDHAKIGVQKIAGNFNEDFYQYFLSVAKRWEQRGVCVIMMPPSIYDKQYNTCIEQINYLSMRLKNDGHPFHAETSLFAYPDSLMFDTAYHINKKGVDRRTMDMIKALK